MMITMTTIQDLINKEVNRKAVIIGAGASVKNYQNKISTFICKNNAVTIGINNMTEFWIPDYHLWTNTQRFRTYGNNIRAESKLLLGCNIPLKIIRNTINRDYTLIDYTDVESTPIDYHDGKIYGYYRTAGCLAIMILHLMGVSEINIVGMDGYTLHSRDKLQQREKSQHCYGEGHTDTADWDSCVKKDTIIKNVLLTLKNYGIKFRIITPTKYKEFYDGQQLLYPRKNQIKGAKYDCS